MKFGFVLPNLAGGGAEKAIAKIAAALADSGHEVHMILLEHGGAHTAPAGVQVHALTAPGVAVAKGFFAKPLVAWRLRRAIARLARARAFDMIVSTLPFADEIATRARLPRHWCRVANTLSVEIARLQARDPIKAARRRERYRRLYDRRRVIAVSQGVATDLRDRLGFVGAHIECVYNPFDVAAIQAAAAVTPAGSSEDRYIVHVGRFNAQKRHDLLLDAFARVPTPHRLVLLTESAPGLVDLIRARGLSARVTIAGFQPNPYPWIARADLLVLCSDHEGLPNVIVEALILDTPVVSTDCPSGPREILGAARPECLVPVNDAAALAQAIAAALARGRGGAPVDLSPFRQAHAVARYEQLAATANF